MRIQSRSNQDFMECCSFVFVEELPSANLPTGLWRLGFSVESSFHKKVVVDGYGQL